MIFDIEPEAGPREILVCPTCFGGLIDDSERCLHCGAIRPPRGWEREDVLGRCLLGRYEVTRRLGAGATGAVYEARDRRAAEGEPDRVAVKFLHAELATKEKLALRFRREALAAAQIDHPGVARTIAYGERDGGSCFLVMEHVSGRSLHELLTRERRLTVDVAVDLGLQIAEALEAAHAEGVVHRDLKPANIFLVRGEDGRDRVKILDFGYAVIKSPERGGHRLTGTGIVLGTPAYMSPEQTRAQRSSDETWVVDGRSDLFALGVLLYRALSGRLPLFAETVHEQLAMQRNDRPPPLRDAAPRLELPPRLDAIVMKLLAKRPTDRYRTAREVRKALWPLSPAKREVDRAGRRVGESPRGHKDVPPASPAEEPAPARPAPPARPTGEYADATIDESGAMHKPGGSPLAVVAVAILLAIAAVLAVLLLLHLI